MIYLIYGADTWRAQEALNKIKDKLAQKGIAELDIINLDSHELTFDQIKNACQSIGFFVPERLVIINNLLSSGSKNIQEQLTSYLSKIPKSCQLVFFEETKPAPTSRLFRQLAQKAQILEFGLLSFSNLNKWVKEQVSKRGGKINNVAVDKLTFFVGPDLWRMNQEINKLLNYKGDEEVTSQDVQNLVNPTLSPSIFDFIDSLGAKNSRKALKILKELVVSGESPLYILAMICYQFKNLLIIKDLLERGYPPYKLAQKTRLHPFVIQKSLNLVKNFSLASLKKIYRKLMDADLAMKTGEMDQTLALELLVIALTR